MFFPSLRSWVQVLTEVTSIWCFEIPYIYTMLRKCQGFFLILSFANHIIGLHFFFLSIPGCSVFACLLFLEKKHSVPKSLVKHSIKVLESPEMFRGIYDGGTPTTLQGLDPKEASTTWMLMLWRYRVIYHKVICLWVLLCGARPVLKSWNLALVSPL